jgi:hypothetical protein
MSGIVCEFFLKLTQEAVFEYISFGQWSHYTSISRSENHYLAN